MGRQVVSSFCSGGDCLAVERVSSLCGTGATCVGVSAGTDEIVVRDTKNPDRPGLHFTLEEWAAFVAGVRAGEFDVEVLTAPIGGVLAS